MCLSVYFQINGEWGTEIVEYFAFLFSIKNETMIKPSSPDSGPCRTDPSAGDYWHSQWRHGASFPGLLRESEAAGRGERGPGCRSGSSGDNRHCAASTSAPFSGNFFFKNPASVKQAEESREFPLRAGRSYRRAPGRFYLYKPGMLASWRATGDAASRC